MPIIIKVALLIVSALFAGSGVTSVVQRLQEQPSSTPIEVKVATPAPTLQATSTPTPKVKSTSTKSSPKPKATDPVVECGTEYQKQISKTFMVKKSVCDSYVDCQMGGYVLKADRESCEKYQRLLQEKIAGIKQQSDAVNCQTRTGWIVMKKEECAAYQEQWRQERTAQIVREEVEKRTREENKLIQDIFNQ